MAEKTFGNRVVGISGDSCDAVVVNRRDDATGVSAISIAGCFDCSLGCRCAHLGSLDESSGESVQTKEHGFTAEVRPSTPILPVRPRQVYPRVIRLDAFASGCLMVAESEVLQWLVA